MNTKIVTKYVLGGIAALALGTLLVGAIAMFWLTRDLPSYDALAHYEPPITTRVYAGNGTLIGEYARERRIFVPVGEMPPLVRDAFLSAEDKNFYSHPGIDFIGIIRATLNNVPNVVENKELHGGASTITQQVARIFLLSNEVTISRKLREMVLAMRIDSALSKDQILELYLNEIFLGENSYGVAAAALNYFGKSLDELSVAQAAYLGALPKGPANYQPVRRKAAAIERRNWVIDQMQANGYITRAQAVSAKAEDLVTFERPAGAVAPDVDYFVEEVRRILYTKYGEQSLYDGGLQVRSTLNTQLQDIAVRSLRSGLVAYDRRHGYRGPITKIDLNTDWAKALKAVPDKAGVATWRIAIVTGLNAKSEADIVFVDGTKAHLPASETIWAKARYPANAVKPGDVIYAEPVLPEEAKGPDEFRLREIPIVQGAIIALDPFTGHVLALSGGFSYATSQFDRAMQAQRQPGSTFKPFVYATALDNGYTPVSKVLDEPFTINPGPGQPLWTPGNYEANEFLGLATLRRGVELSHNVMTARLANDVGMTKVAATVARMGVYDKLDTFIANSLGAQVTTLIRLTTGYAEFVNGGRKLTATLIDRVQDRHGKTVYRFDARACPGCNEADWRGQEEPLLDENRPQVLDPRTAYQIVSILEGVIQRGTGAAIKSVGKPLAGKTGTSSDWRDAWFVGFSPDLALGVFVGKDDFTTLGSSAQGAEQGALAAAPIFRDFMTEALAGQPATPFRIPSGIVLVPINPLTGAVVPSGTPGSILEAFKPGTEPGSDNADFDEGPATAEGPAEPSTAATPPPPTNRVGQGTGGLY